MAHDAQPLTGRTRIRTWLASPEGGPLLRSLLVQGRVPEATLDGKLDAPLEHLVELTRWRFTPEVVEFLVRAVNDGDLVEQGDPARPAGRRGTRWTGQR